VLLAEDNAVNQRVAVLLLERLGCRVDVAGNGLEALDLSGRLPYDIIFLDCQMPELDGYGAARAIREREAGGLRVPIIALTANAMAGDREECLAAGMDDYLSKPVDFASLASALQRYAADGRARVGA
jgi:CheY-like chemotaxis protein